MLTKTAAIAVFKGAVESTVMLRWCGFAFDGDGRGAGPIGCSALRVFISARVVVLRPNDSVQEIQTDWRRAITGNLEERRASLAPDRSPRDRQYYRDRVQDRKSTRLNSSHIQKSRMPSSA